MPVFADFWSPPHSSGVLPESNSAMMGQSWSSASHPPSYFPQLRNSLQSPTSPPPLHYDSLSYPPTLVRNTITPFAPAYTNRPLPSQPTQHSQRNPSHLDLPNFPLPRPFHDVPNSARQDEDSYPVYGRDIGSSPFQLPSFDTLPSNPLTSVSRPASRLSSGSEGDFVFDLPSWPTSQTHDGFIDLTAEPSPSTMPVTTRKRPASTLQASTPSSSTPSSSAKRKRTDDGINRKTEKIEQVDLREVDDDYGLSQVLEQQRLMSIKAQQELADKPVNFSSLQCIICMESMTDITVTHCGRSIPEATSNHSFGR